MVEFVAIFAAVILACVALASSCRGGIQQVFTAPIVIATGFFVLIHLALPVLQWRVGFFRYESSYSERSYVQSMLIVSLGHFLFRLALLAFPVRLSGLAERVVLESRVLMRAFRWSAAVFSVGLVAALIHANAIMARGIAEYMRDRISFGVGDGGSTQLAHWMSVGCILMFFVRQGSGADAGMKRRATRWFVVFSLCACVYYVVVSSRNSIFIVVLNVMAIAFVFSGGVRARLSRAYLRRIFSAVSVCVLAVGVFCGVGKLRLDIVRDDDTSFAEYGLAKALNGAFGNHENVVWLMGSDFSLSMGGTYLAALTNFVPRNLWEEKPLGAGPRLKNLISPGSYVVGSEGNSSLTTGLFAELMLNFGYMGVALGGVFLAVIVGSLARWFGRSRSSFVRLALLYSVVAWSTQVYYAEFLGFFARYVVTLVPFVLLAFVFGVRGRSSIAVSGV